MQPQTVTIQTRGTILRPGELWHEPRPGKWRKSPKQYNKIYNNTVYGETDQREWEKAGWRIDNNSSLLMFHDNSLFKNSITVAVSVFQVDL